MNVVYGRPLNNRLGETGRQQHREQRNQTAGKGDDTKLGGTEVARRHQKHEKARERRNHRIDARPEHAPDCANGMGTIAWLRAYHLQLSSLRVTFPTGCASEAVNVWNRAQTSTHTADCLWGSP